MKHIARRTAGIVAAAALTTTVVVGCSSDDNDDANVTSAVTSAMEMPSDSTSAGAENSEGAENDVELTAADGTKVTLTGSIAKKYSAATPEQQKDLGKPMTGDDASGTSESGVMFQQFDGGVITVKEGSDAYITWGKIRDAWNVDRDEDGEPSKDGKSGSNGPLGAPTSDETTEGTVKTSTFEHGKITWDSATNKVEVTVNDKVVDTE